MKKRFLTMLLALVMVFSLFPTTALAGWGYGAGKHSTGKREPETPTVTWKGNRWDGTSGLEVKVTGADLSNKIRLSVEMLGEDEAAQYFAAIKAAGGKLVNPIALNISLKNGKEDYQPTSDVQVSITRSGVTLSDTVYHFVDAEEEADEEADEEVQPSIKAAPDLRGSKSSVGDDDESGDVYEIDKDTDASVVPALKFVPLTSSTSGDTVTVTTNHFSVYVVGETTAENRVKVVFKNAASELATIYVKQSDTTDAEIYKTVLYEPPFEPGAGVVFKGWSTDPNYTPASAKTIEMVRTDVAELCPPAYDADETGGTTVTYYAVLVKQYKINFIDPTGGVMTQEILEYRADATGDDLILPYTIRTSYTADDNHGFLGWYADGTIVSAQAMSEPEDPDEEPTLVNVDPPYKVGTQLEIKSDVTFTAYAPEGRWLIFDENGKGATYNAPQFVKSGEVTTRPRPDSEMTRLGYTFGGWYKDADCTDGNEFEFGHELTDKTTIYAKWTPGTSAAYTVIIWKQNVNGNGYDFAESVALAGTPGQVIDTVTSTGTGNGAYASVNGTAKQYTGFHFKEYDQNVKIAPEGGTVLNVYYDRNEYTLTFQVEGSGYVKSDSTSSGYYYIPDGNGSYTGVYLTRSGNSWTYSNYEYVYSVYTGTNPDRWTEGYGTNDNGATYFRVYYRNNRWRTSNSTSGTVYSGTVYTRSYQNVTHTYTGDVYTYVNNALMTVYTITALYEQPIGDHFPIGENYPTTNGEVYNSGERWKPGTNSLGWDEVMVFIEIMPNDNVTFTLNTSDADAKTMNYYVEALPGETVDKTFGGKNFHLYNTVKANYNGVTVEDYIEIAGCTKFGVDPSYTYNNGSFTYYVGSQGSTAAATTVNFYYTRNVFALNYMDGAYFDGNGNDVTENENNMGQLGVESNIAYGADISGKGSYRPTSTPAGYVFEGWYLNKECSKAVEFVDADNNPLTMPDGGLTVYAKWRQIQYRVFLHPQVPETDTSLDWGKEDQAMNFRISYGGKVSLPTGLRDDYEFIGWYTSPECTSDTMFTQDTALNESTVTTAYDKNAAANTTDVMNKWGNVVSTTPDRDNNGSAGWNSDQWQYTEVKDDNGNVMQIINQPIDRFWITKKLDLYAKWSPKLSGDATGVGVLYSLYDPDLDKTGSGTAVDTTKYKPGTTAYAVPGVTGPAGYKFDHWVMQTWSEDENDYVDVEGSVIFAGDEYVVNKDLARITTETVEVVDPDTNETTTVEHTYYTIQLRAAYVEDEQATPTYVPWFKNDGTSYFRIDGKYDDLNGYGDGKQTLMINEGIDLSAVTVPTRAGCVFLGWAFVTMGTNEQDAATFMTTNTSWTQNGLTPDVYYNAANDKYYTDAEFTKEAKQVAADENMPYQAIFAVWEEQYFYVFHSSNATVERVSLADVETFDLTLKVRPGYLYGGYYKDYSGKGNYDEANPQEYTSAVPNSETYSGGKGKWAKADAYSAANGDDIGTALKPLANKTYYLKEVPNTYLATKVLWGYDWRNQYNVTDIYALTVVDDACYSSFGYEVGADNNTMPARFSGSFSYQNRGSETVTKYTPANLGCTSGGYIGAVNLRSIIASIPTENGGIAIHPFWVTLDGVEVTTAGGTFACSDGATLTKDNFGFTLAP